MVDHTYIVSTGRTGTKALATLFNKYDAVRAAHESLPPFQKGGVELAHGEYSRFRRWWMKQLFRVSRSVHDDIGLREANKVYSREAARGRFPFILPAFSAKNIAKNGLVRVWRRLVDPPGHYVEGNNFLFSMIPMIRDVFDNATIVHVVRDGRGFVKSAMNRGYFAEEDFRAHLRGDKHGDYTLEEWQSMNKLEKNAWLWAHKNQVIESFNPDVQVSFKSIFKDDSRPGLRRICDEAGLPYDEDVVSSTLSTRIHQPSSELFDSFESFPEEWKERFWEIAGDMMRHYEYDTL